MDQTRKEELMRIYQGWIIDTICQWEDEIGAWDHMIDVDLTEEEWEWVRGNLNCDVNVFDMND